MKVEESRIADAASPLGYLPGKMEAVGIGGLVSGSLKGQDGKKQAVGFGPDEGMLK